MTPREQLDGMMGDLKGEMDRLRTALEAKEKENANLKARVEEFESELANSVNGGASCRLHEARLRKQHYRECEEIARKYMFVQGSYLAAAIARAREEGK